MKQLRSNQQDFFTAITEGQIIHDGKVSPSLLICVPVSAWHGGSGAGEWCPYGDENKKKTLTKMVEELCKLSYIAKSPERALELAKSADEKGNVMRTMPIVILKMRYTEKFAVET